MMRESFGVRLEELTYECFQCGVCATSCLMSPSLNPRKILRAAQLNKSLPQVIWKCIACRYCESLCLRGVNISEIMRYFKSSMYSKREVPSDIYSVLWNILEEGNPLGVSKSKRTDWLKDLKLETLENSDILIYVCCASAYDKRLQKPLKDLIKVLERANVKVGTIKDEVCCGDIVYQIGDDSFFEEIANKNVERIEKLESEIILTISPHCYNTLRNLYPKYGAKLSIEVMHYTEYLANLINEGKLSPGKLEETVTYHDPCMLGRYNGLYKEPRTILKSIEGLEIVEMEHAKDKSLCCGGGGGGYWIGHEELRDVTKRRLQEAVKTEAKVLATACPYCIRMFEDEIKLERVDLKVFDVVEILTQSFTW